MNTIKSYNDNIVIYVKYLVVPQLFANSSPSHFYYDMTQMSCRTEVEKSARTELRFHLTSFQYGN